MPWAEVAMAFKDASPWHLAALLVGAAGLFVMGLSKMSAQADRNAERLHREKAVKALQPEAQHDEDYPKPLAPPSKRVPSLKLKDRS